MEIGHKIRKVRELKNFTQEYLANQLQVSQSTYCRFEKDDGDITLNQLNSIAEILDVKVDDLLNFNDKHVFNNFGSAHDDSFSINYSNGLLDNERALYEKTIKSLEEQIELLKRSLK